MTKEVTPKLESPPGMQSCHPRLDADIVCVGFGPAMGGFLTTLSRGLLNPDGSPAVESPTSPGLPPQVLCYERADDVGFGVSGLVTRGRAIRASFQDLDLTRIPLATPVTEERIVYLLDPIGASRRPALWRLTDRVIRAVGRWLPYEFEAVNLPWSPGFLHKRDGLVLSLGQFNQWVATQVQSTGAVQVWPATPVREAVIEDQAVVGVRLLDQGTDRQGRPADGFSPGLEVRAALTVVGDGPVGPIGQQLDQHFGLPPGHLRRDWAVGMKMVVELPPGVDLKPGTVLHTLGYPEPELFGFFYVHPDRIASLGIFVPSWFPSPVRTAYRYLQHWMMHPYLWRYLKGGRLRSWGAKTLQESGRRGEPWLVGEGYARIGEGSGSTNILTNSGVDEAWATGTFLAESVLELLRTKEPFSKANLERTYLQRRRASWVEQEGRIAERARDGFHSGVMAGLASMALAGLTRGRLSLGRQPRPPHQHVQTLEEYCGLHTRELDRLREDCAVKGLPFHSAIMDRCGWPPVPYDGQLLVSHQDALLLGGKVQAASGYADHVSFIRPELCKSCGQRVCIELCSGQALTPGPEGVPAFDREKCVFCGACLWNCSQPAPANEDQGNIAFGAGAGGLHSAEN